MGTAPTAETALESLLAFLPYGVVLFREHVRDTTLCHMGLSYLEFKFEAPLLYGGVLPS